MRPEKKIQKFRNMLIDDALAASARLKRISGDKYSGWEDYVKLLEDYVDKVMKRKAIFRYDVATDAEIQEMKYLDREAWMIKNFIVKIPQIFVNGLEKRVETINKEEENA